MREKLAPLVGKRFRFRATYSRRALHTRGGYGVERCLFHDVVDALSGSEMTDHVHFDLAQWNRNLQPGDRIEFDATVSAYVKGYYDDRRLDYKLTRPSRVRLLDQKPKKRASVADPDQYRLELLFTS